VSIVEVARVAGVSPATVSRVINGGRGVSRERARRVHEAMRHVGYVPPPLAQRPGRRRHARPRRAHSVALLLLDALYDYTPALLPALLRGCQCGATDYGLNLLVAHAQRDDELPPMIRNGQVDGVIVVGASASARVTDALRHLPTVWFSSHHEPDADAVMIGNDEIGRLAANYLLDRGRRHLAVLGAMAQFPAYAARAEAFAAAAAKRGAGVATFMDAQPEPIDGGDSEMAVLRETIEPLADQLAHHRPMIDGVYVCNDLMTSIAYPLFARAGRRVGEDLDVISCNNETPLLIALRPRPATIDLGIETLARRSVDQLIWRIEHPGAARQVQMTIRPVLVPGDA